MERKGEEKDTVTKEDNGGGKGKGGGIYELDIMGGSDWNYGDWNSYQGTEVDTAYLRSLACLTAVKPVATANSSILRGGKGERRADADQVSSAAATMVRFRSPGGSTSRIAAVSRWLS